MMIPKGWKLVPIKPTGMMLGHGHRNGGQNVSCGMIYRAMVAAAPEPPTFVCTGDALRCQDGNGCECEMEGRIAKFIGEGPAA